jgi:hypothetical protein
MQIPTILAIMQEIKKAHSLYAETFRPSIFAAHRLQISSSLPDLCRSLVANIDVQDLEPRRKMADAITGRMLQLRLREAGYDPGPIDGKFGQQTKAALCQFQRQQGLRITGELDDASRKALKIP